MSPEPSDRVLAVGQWLGSTNRIRALRYLKTWGWVATDTTGAEYAQRFPPGGDRYRRVLEPAGLHAADRADASTRQLTPWPAAPTQVVATATCPSCNGRGVIDATAVVDRFCKDMNELRRLGLLDIFREQNRDMLRRLRAAIGSAR